MARRTDQRGVARAYVLTLYPSLAVPGYRRLWLGIVPYHFAFQLSLITTGFAAVTLSHSAVAVGLDVGAWGQPILIVPPPCGVAADRFTRRRILLFAQRNEFRPDAACASSTHEPQMIVRPLLVAAEGAKTSARSYPAELGSSVSEDVTSASSASVMRATLVRGHPHADGGGPEVAHLGAWGRRPAAMTVSQ